MKWLGRALSALAALAFAAVGACGLDQGGLLGLVADADLTEGGGDPPGNAEATIPDEGGGDAAAADSVVDSSAGASADAPLADRRGGVATDAPPDGRLDGPRDTAFDVLDSQDSPGDSAPLPIVWDGAAIVDPQFSDADWVDFCAALVACNVLPSLSACVSLLPQPASPELRITPPSIVSGVLSAAPSCAAVRAALGDGSNCLSVAGDSCLNGSLLSCRWGFKMTIDCGSLGMVCSSGSGNAGCGFGDCAASQEGLTYCVDSSHLARCSSGRYVPALDCQALGATCVGPDGLARCQGTGGSSCSGGEGCAGTSLVMCLGGQNAGVDCSSIYGPSFTCLVGDAGGAVCAAGAACDGAITTDACVSSTQLSYCNAGLMDLYDCNANGYASCASGRCVP